MKKIILIIVVVVFVIFLAIYLYGLSLPAEQKFKASKTIATSPQKIWQVLSDWKGQKEWRTDLKKVEVIDDKTFLEYPHYGPPIRFELLKIEQPTFMELKLTHPRFTSIYKITLTQQGEKTLLEEDYVFNYPSPMTRVLIPIFFNIDEFSKTFFNNLEKQVLKK